MRIAATQLEHPARADTPAPPAKRDFSRQLKMSKRATGDQASDATPSTNGQPQTLGQIVIALLGAGNAEPHPDASLTGFAGTKPTAIAVPTAPTTDPATDPTTALAAAGTVSTPVAKPELPLTPLEQAVHDLLSDLGGAEGHGEQTASTLATLAPLAPIVAALETPDAPVAAQPAATIAPPQQPVDLTSQHHAHIVLDEPGLRVVMTVAVRGSEVNVNVRSSDDQTAAALARNAGSLDEAMRAHKLDLNSFTSERESTGDHDHKPRPEREKPARPFVLEETV